IDSYAGADNLTIANNIFNNTNIPGGQGGIQLQSGSFDDLTVEQNLFQFTGDGDALLVGGGGSFERMHIVGNHFAGTTGGIFQNGGTINDAVVEQNEFTGGVGMNMGDAGNIQIRENTFDGTFYTGFQVGTIDGEIVGNTFQNIEAYPGFFGQAFELWGGQYGTTVSQNVTIENNVIHYNDVAGAAEPTHGIRLRTPDAGSGIDASTI
ncbi:MAG: right-handed parallel beta-helix repeat-containing protein, partial [Gimesia chilikensis]